MKARTAKNSQKITRGLSSKVGKPSIGLRTRTPLIDIQKIDDITAPEVVMEELFRIRAYGIAENANKEVD